MATSWEDLTITDFQRWAFMWDSTSAESWEWARRGRVCACSSVRLDAARPHDSDRRDGGHQGLLHEAAAAHTASAAARAYCTPINGRGQCCDRACSSLLLACAERSL